MLKTLSSRQTGWLLTYIWGSINIRMAVTLYLRIHDYNTLVLPEEIGPQQGKGIGVRVEHHSQMSQME